MFVACEFFYYGRLLFLYLLRRDIRLHYNFYGSRFKLNSGFGILCFFVFLFPQYLFFIWTFISLTRLFYLQGFVLYRLGGFIFYHHPHFSVLLLPITFLFFAFLTDSRIPPFLHFQCSACFTLFYIPYTIRLTYSMLCPLLHLGIFQFYAVFFLSCLHTLLRFEP